MFYVNLVLLIFCLFFIVFVLYLSDDFESNILGFLLFALLLFVLFFPPLLDNSLYLFHFFSHWGFTLGFSILLFLFVFCFIISLFLELSEIKKCIHFEDYLKQKELGEAKESLEQYKSKVKELSKELEGGKNEKM